jgi:ubiquitin-conjugating enzyme E2 Q
VWFADSDDLTVTGSVEMLSNTSGLDNHVISQVGILVKQLCKAQSLPEPTLDLENLSKAMASCSNVSACSSTSTSSKSASGGSGSSSTTDNGSSEDMDIEYEFDDDDDDDEDDDGKNDK